jgi:hypothetical protein
MGSLATHSGGEDVQFGDDARIFLTETDIMSMARMMAAIQTSVFSRPVQAGSRWEARTEHGGAGEE